MNRGIHMIIDNINQLLSSAVKPLRPGTSTYGVDSYKSIDFSRFSEALKFFYNRKMQIYFIRNSNIQYDFIMQDPKMHHRKPLSLINYHEYYIDNNQYWDDYPKRYNSLMFLSTYVRDFDNAGSSTAEYGKYSYFVFPENNSKIGISSKSDFIYSFNLDEDLYTFNTNFRRLYIEITGEDLGIPVDYKSWVNKLNKMQNIYRQETVESELDVNFPFYFQLKILAELMNYSVNKLDDVMLKNELVDFLNEHFNPDSNSFNLVECNTVGLSKVPEDSECWTDGTCLLIKNDVYDMTLKMKHAVESF